MIKLNIFFHNEEDDESIKLGLKNEEDIDFRNHKIEEITFYQINYIAKYDELYCEIASNGTTFIANETYEAVNKKIRDSKIFFQN